MYIPLFLVNRVTYIYLILYGNQTQVGALCVYGHQPVCYFIPREVFTSSISLYKYSST